MKNYNLPVYYNYNDNFQWLMSSTNHLLKLYNDNNIDKNTLDENLRQIIASFVEVEITEQFNKVLKNNFLGSL